MNKILTILFPVFIFFQILPGPLWAASTLSLDPAQFSSIGQLLSDDLTKAVVTMAGLMGDHRPYEPATPMGTNLGLDLSLELTLVRIPQEFKDALNKAGLSAGNIPPTIPIPMLHAHKGLGSQIDLGVTYIGYKIIKIYGGDIKLAVYQPEEGPTYALRFNYSRAKIAFITTKTITPQILVSKEVGYFDPYLGVGYQWISGEIEIPVPMPQLPPEAQAIAAQAGLTNLVLKNSASASGYMFFLGCGMKLGPSGLKLTPEMGYSQLGGSTLGIKFGLRL